MGLAQFDYAIDLGFNVPINKHQEVRELCNKLKLICTGMPSNQSYGVGCKEFTDNHMVAHDLNEVLRHRLSWDENPEGGGTVNFHAPFKVSKQPLAEIKRTDSSITKDGWSSEKPKTVGLYQVREADKQTLSLNNIIIKKIKGVLWAVNQDSGYKCALSEIENTSKYKCLWRKAKKL
jgi:hypothetical protein